ncbi:MAG: hypothetical protein FJZ01_23115 [Candidatus Sericytochromatia bacterium]|nr:hypothetical protein [Candidatus Tanganyikabacteria bacterium]
MTKLEHSLRATDRLKQLMAVETAAEPVPAPMLPRPCKACCGPASRERFTSMLREARALLSSVIGNGNGQLQAVPAEVRA